MLEADVTYAFLSLKRPTRDIFLARASLEAATQPSLAFLKPTEHTAWPHSVIRRMFNVSTSPGRVTALRILCELRLEKDDLHNVVEHALHPPRKTKAEKKAEALAAQSGRRNATAEPPMPTMEQMRRQPLARDGSGLMYWYLDYHTTTGEQNK